MTSPVTVSALSAAVLDRLASMTALARYAGRATIAAVWAPPLVDTVTILSRLLFNSLPVVAVVAFFAGAMLTVQAASSLALIGGGPLSGTLVGFGGVREVFPLLAAASVAARSGAEFASELGAMKVTEQVDALEVMGLDPMRMLVGPRVVAAVLGTPLCVLTADAVGLLGAQVIGTLQLGIDPGSMWGALTASVVIPDLVIGMGKGLILGWLIAIVTTFEGLTADGGASGVGRATNQAVVRAMIVTCVASLGLTVLIYGRALLG